MQHKISVFFFLHIKSSTTNKYIFQQAGTAGRQTGWQAEVGQAHGVYAGLPPARADTRA